MRVEIDGKPTVLAQVVVRGQPGMPSRRRTCEGSQMPSHSTDKRERYLTWLSARPWEAVGARSAP